ncbi:glucose 1-dehydrogenase [Neobacillus vireti]|uniref:glucose 1-dehydrogenase n=1 Tax=Neobacillus vireti TaxID=220686 RepID=UPI002FFF7B69
MQKFDFTNKVAVVTGGGGGIGRAVSLKLAEAGAKVVIVDISEDAGMVTVNQITTQGGEAIFIQTDVTKEEDIQNYVQTTIDRYGKIDIFLNNAGWEGKISSLVDYPTEEFDRVMSINVRGVFLGLKYVMPYMIAQKSGAIVNTASAAGLQGTPNLAAYGASKHAVLGLTKTAGFEGAIHGIRVNAVCPGPVNTEMMCSIERGFGKGDPEAALISRKAMAVKTPTGRYAKPEEIANLMMYLVSDFSTHIIGQQFVIDGGLILT